MILTRRSLLAGMAMAFAPSRFIQGGSPTKRYTENGFDFDETSDEWKVMCQALPCFAALHWPDYSTKVVEDTINGQRVVIQLWKGYCPQFLNSANFPGGVGAEVGIYRRIPGKQWGSSPPAGFPAALFTAMKNMAGSSELWWAYPELRAEVDFEFVNPETNSIFFRHEKQTTYWCNKWMQTKSYDAYKASRKTPLMAWNYTLKYTINGKTYPSW
jgi:hypothetical protein